MTIETTEKLIRAVKIGNLKGVKRSLVEGVDPYAKGKDGACALDWANIIGNSDIINILEKASMSYETAKEREREIQERISEMPTHRPVYY